MTLRQRIVEEARSWLRTPYHHQGRLKGVGVDCAMLPIEVYSAVGVIASFDPRPYPPDWHLHRSAERYLTEVAKRTTEVLLPLPGDLALFRFGRCFAHGTIVVEWPLLIHAETGANVCYADVPHHPRLGDGRPVRFFTPKGVS